MCREKGMTHTKYSSVRARILSLCWSDIVSSQILDMSTEQCIRVSLLTGIVDRAGTIPATSINLTEPEWRAATVCIIQHNFTTTSYASITQLPARKLIQLEISNE